MVPEWVKKPPRSPAPRLSVLYGTWNLVVKKISKKWVLRKLGGMEDRWAWSLRRWNNKQKGNYSSKLSYEQLGITAFYSHSSKMKVSDTSKYSGLVDWRKTGVEIGVENTVIKPWAGKRYSPLRHRAHQRASDGAVISILPFRFLLSAIFLSLLAVRTDGNH